jgi:hypothetical protein
LSTTALHDCARRFNLTRPRLNTAGALDAIGWKHRDRTPITTSSAAHITKNTRDALRRLRLLAPDSRVATPERVTPQAVAFARTAVRAWPSAAKSTPRS